MSPSTKRTIAVTVVGVLVLLAVVTFFTELHSSENHAKIFGSAACVAAMIFYALGWVKRKKR
jgi:drug/metabolite transporter (DMT)-like permease